ncbi:MAG: outer membrane protein assembly factor BamA [Beggiatoa sp. IS2]|nr:MAG: outer membrane protein assembly factor BamA [Beggiatoa sp. IS2]
MFFSGTTQAFSAFHFQIEDIRLEGLRRISAGTVFNYLAVKKGDYLDPDGTKAAIETLFKTGLFKDVRLTRIGNVLIVELEERPAIAKITITGNENIGSDELKKSLKNVGFAEGHVFNRSLLEQVELELQRQYFNLGKYAVRIQSTVQELERNRVEVSIEISEGVIAKIRQITLVGNREFSESELLSELELSVGGWFSFFSNRDQYNKQKLGADLETLRSFYLDRGYVNFSIDSTQVAITPDKKDVYITINLTEGDKYTVTGVKLLGSLIVPEAELMEKISIQTGNTFSGKEVSKSTEALIERLGEEGYLFAKVNALPDLDKDKQTVTLNFFIDPGKRIYVRRINFSGNSKTRDEVMRREMRQMESAWASGKDIKRSKTRLERLGYFEDVTVETPVVSDDQVDVNYTVVERPSGNLMAGIGFSQAEGFLINASLSQDNFLGSGKRVGVEFNNSQVRTTYRFSYFNPYVTIDGVSRGFNVFYRKTDAEEANLSRYTTDMYGASLNYGIPMSEFSNLGLGFRYDNTFLRTTDYSAQEIFDFVKANGDQYNTYRISASWERDTRNRYFLADRGTLQSVSAEVAVPPSDLTYYTVGFRHQWLYPLTTDYTLLMEGNIAYGDGFGNTTQLPFFENYYAGGPHTVRGFKQNTLGPLDSSGLPFGGNLKIVGNAEVIIPVPFTKNMKSVRTSAFFDIGNVYGNDEQFDGGALRYSTGIAALWLSPIGILSFSLAQPLNTKDGDQIQRFQFSIGATF